MSALLPHGSKGMLGWMMVFGRTYNKNQNIIGDGMIDNRERQGEKRYDGAAIGLWLWLATVAIVLWIAWGIGEWDKRDKKTEYYADYVDRWGQPEGVGKLSESQVKERERHYRFESVKGQLRLVVYANSAGTPVDDYERAEHIARPSIQELVYAENGLIAIVRKNAKNITTDAHFFGGEKATTIDINKINLGSWILQRILSAIS